MNYFKLKSKNLLVFKNSLYSFVLKENNVLLCICYSVLTGSRFFTEKREFLLIHNRLIEIEKSLISYFFVNKIIQYPSTGMFGIWNLEDRKYNPQFLHTENSIR